MRRHSEWPVVLIKQKAGETGSDVIIGIEEDYEPLRNRYREIYQQREARGRERHVARIQRQFSRQRAV